MKDGPSRLTVALLGGFELAIGSGSPRVLPTRKAQALLAYLAVEPGRRHSRDALAALLWGDRRDVQARRSLRQAVYAIRKALPEVAEPLFVTHGGGIALNPEAVDADVPRLERLVREGTPEALERAATLYRGDFLRGFWVEAAGFDDWLVAERERLRGLAIEGLAKLLAHQERTTATERAIQTAVQLLGLDPLQEVTHRTLMRLYARQGRRTEALRQYQLCVDVLQRELRTGPEAETKQLYQELLRQRHEVATGRACASTAPGRRTVTAGEGRLELPIRVTPLIGRDTELERLQQVARQAEEGRGRIAIVFGEAGIGKTRLLAEVAADALERGGDVLLGRAFESERLLAFGSWVAAIRGSRVLEEPGVLDAVTPALRSDLARLFPELAEPAAASAEGGENYRRLFEAMGALLSGMSERRPVLLLLEDLHWADEMSVRLLCYLGRRNSTWRLLIIASAREEQLVEPSVLRGAIDELLEDDRCIELRLRPLNRRATAELVRAFMRSAGPPASGLEEQIWTASRGNPFMAVEMVRAIQQGTEISPITPLSTPEGVRKLITRRLDRLTDRGQHLLAVAAVIGREFEFGLLQRAAGLEGREAAEGLEELVQRGVLHGTGERFDFTHDRICEVAYLRLLPPMRRVLHGEVVAALEAMYGEHGEHAEGLAHHAVQAEMWPKAATYLWEAGRNARARSAYQQAISLLEHALQILPRLTETSELLAVGVDLVCGDLWDPLMTLRQEQRLLGHLRQAAGLAEKADDRARLADVLARSVRPLLNVGQDDRAVKTGEQSFAIASETGDLLLRALAGMELGHALSTTGDLHRAEALLRQVLSVLQSATPRQDSPHVQWLHRMTLDCLVHVLGSTGRYGEAVRHGEEALRLAEVLGHPAPRAVALYRLGRLHCSQGAVDKAIALSSRALALGRERDVQVVIPLASACLGAAYTLAERIEDAIAHLEAALAAAESADRRDSVTLISLGRAYLAAGRLADASRCADLGLVWSGEQAQRSEEAEALHLMGDIASRRDPPAVEDAVRYYRRAHTLAADFGMRPLAAHCHLGLGELFVRTDETEQAREHFLSARAIYRELDMQFWLERAEAGRREVPESSP